jgi:hypothetical protein
VSRTLRTLLNIHLLLAAGMGVVSKHWAIA